MKSLFKKVLCSLLFVCLCLSLGVVKNAHARMIYKEVASLELPEFGYYSYHKTSFDINDDGIDENFEVQAEYDQSGNTNCRVYMNDTLMLTVRSPYEIFDYYVSHIVLANGIHYLHIYDEYEDGDNTVNKMYYYDKNTNSFKLSYDIEKEYDCYCGTELKYIQNNTLKFILMRQPNELGFVHLYLNSVAKGTTFKRTSLYGQAKMFNRSNTLKARRAIIMTTKPGGKKRAFTLRKNQKATVTDCYYTSRRKLWIKFKKGKKSGWFSCNRSFKDSTFSTSKGSESRFFYGIIYGR